MPTPELYGEQAGGLLPPGRLWSQRPESTLRRLLGAIGAVFSRVHAAQDALLVELYPLTTSALLPEYEALLGLPDACTPTADQTLQERRARVVERLTIQPRPTLLYLVQLAAAIGYSAEVVEGPGDFEVTVGVDTGRVTYFRTGESECGDLLGNFTQAADLECLLREQKPAHIELVFSYTGA